MMVMTMNPELVNNVKVLCERLSINKIVIHSSWVNILPSEQIYQLIIDIDLYVEDISYDLVNMLIEDLSFNQRALNDMNAIDYTKHLRISNDLITYNTDERYLILDDQDCFKDELKEHLYLVNKETGLDSATVDDIVEKYKDYFKSKATYRELLELPYHSLEYNLDYFLTDTINIFDIEQFTNIDYDKVEETKRLEKIYIVDGEAYSGRDWVLGYLKFDGVPIAFFNGYGRGARDGYGFSIVNKEKFDDCKNFILSFANSLYEDTKDIVSLDDDAYINFYGKNLFDFIK